MNGKTSRSIVSSQEIARVTEKPHEQIVEDIRNLLISIYGAEEVEREVPRKRRRGLCYFRLKLKYALLNSWELRFGAGGFFTPVSAPAPGSCIDRGICWTRDSRGEIGSFCLSEKYSILLGERYSTDTLNRIIDYWVNRSGWDENVLRSFRSGVDCF